MIQKLLVLNTDIYLWPVVFLFFFFFLSTLTWIMLKYCFPYLLFILPTSTELHTSTHRLRFAKPSCFHLVHQTCHSQLILLLHFCTCSRFSWCFLIWEDTTTHTVILAGFQSYLAQHYDKFPVSTGNASPAQLGQRFTAVAVHPSAFFHSCQQVKSFWPWVEMLVIRPQMKIFYC